jgi:hypothetical protein
MNRSKVLAILFTLFSLFALRETFRILTSNEPDIAPNRVELSIMAVILTWGFIFVAIRFWKKASDKKPL